MVLNNAIRRAASRVVPLAIRASGGSQRYLLRHHGAAVLTAVSLSSRNLRHRCSTKAKSDESLLKALTSQLQCAAEAEEKVEIPAGFPFKIEDEDNPGKQIVTLTREYNGENITVEVRPTVIDDDSDSDSDSGDEEGIGDLSSIPLVLRVTKKSGTSLEFGFTAYADEIDIETLLINDPENSEDEITYEGPGFEDLDENVQKSFHEHLETRGIKPSTTNFLYEYMVKKESRECVTWLKNVRKFVRD